MALGPHLITADGTALTQIVGGQVRIYIQITHGLYDGLEVRGGDRVIPSLAGQVPEDRVGHQRVIEGEGFVAGCGSTEAASRADLVDIFDELDALFLKTQMPYGLSVEREDGSERTINARPLDHQYGDDAIPSFRTITVEWLSVDPQWSEGS